MTDRSNYQQVGVDVDDASFDRLIQRVNAARDTIAQLKDANQSIRDSADVAGSRLQEAFQSSKKHIDDSVISVQELRKELAGTIEDLKGIQEAQTDAAGGTLVHGQYGAGAQQLGYGVEGGMIGPSLPPGYGDNSGGGFGVSGLRRTGSALNQLGLGAIGRPVQLAGDIQQVAKESDLLSSSLKGIVESGGPATDVVKDFGGGLGVVTVAGGLAVAALAAIALAGAAFKSELDQASKGLGDAVTQVDDYYKAIARGTTDSINAQIKVDELQKRIDQDKVNTLQAAYNAAHPQDLTGGQSAASAVLTSIFSDLSGGGKQLNKDLEDSKNALNANDIEIKALKQALGDGTVAANDAAEAEKKLQDARDKTADKNIQIAQQTAQLEATGTTKGIQDRITQIEAERKAIGDQIETGQLSIQKTEELKQRTRDLAAEEERLTQVIGPAIAAREKEIEAIDRASKAVTDHANAVDKQNQAEVAAVEKYNTAIKSAEDTADQARLAANNKLNDALVAAAQNAVDAANKALEQLEQQRANLLTGLQRTEDAETRKAAVQRLTDQIKEQRQEVNDLQTHLDNLKQIRDRDASRQRDDLLNRNFRDLFALSEQKTQDMTKENDRYSTQEAQRQQAFDQQEQDQDHALQIQRRERLIAYQQANQDAQKNYQLALDQAQDAKSKAIAAAYAANVKEQAILRQGLIDKEALLKQDAVNQIRLVQQTEAAKTQIFNDLLQQAQQLLGVTQTQGPANSAQRLVDRRTATSYADPGYIGAGQLGKVNDRRDGQRESFNGVPFPPGLGLFIPVHGGYINSGSSSSTHTIGPISVTINESSNPQATEEAVYRALKKVVA